MASYRDRSEAVAWVDDDGIERRYLPDFDVEKHNGIRICVEVKPLRRIEHKGLLPHYRQIEKYAVGSGRFDRFEIWTDLEIRRPVALYNAELRNVGRLNRDGLSAAITVLGALRKTGGRCTMRELRERSNLEGRAFWAVVASLASSEMHLEKPDRPIPWRQNRKKSRRSSGRSAVRASTTTIPTTGADRRPLARRHSRKGLEMLDAYEVGHDEDGDEFEDGEEGEKVSDRQQEIEDAHVDDGLTLRVAEAFEKLKTRAQSPKLEGRGMLICGPSGTGKSHVWERLASGAEFQPYETDAGLVRHVCKVGAPAPCTLKTLGRAVYYELTEVDIRPHVEEHEIWNRVRAHLAAQKVKYLFIDEMQHILVGRNQEKQRKVAETFKTVMQMKRWPVYLVLAGMPESLPFLRLHKQLNRRIRKIEITPVEPGSVGNKAIRRHVELLIGRLGVNVDFDLDDMAARLHAASNGYLGLCALLLKGAAELAHDQGSTMLTTQDLSDAFSDAFAASGKEIDDETNPFLCANLSTAKGIDTKDAGRQTLLVGKGAAKAKLSPRSREWIPMRRHTGEDTLSYALRLTETHGFGSMERFLTEAGIRRPHLTNGIGVNRLAEIGGSAAAAFASESVVLRRDGAVLAGEKLQRTQWSSLKRRYCPRCFADDIHSAGFDLTRPVAWSRVWWSIPDVLTCTIHDVLLRSTCECGNRLNWKGSSVLKCSCGRGLDRARSSPGRCDADRYVVGRLGFGPKLAVSLLDGLPLYDALIAIRKFAEVSSHHRDPIKGRHVAVAALRNDERGVVHLLETTAQQKFDSTGVTSRFGLIHEFARDLGESAVRERLLAIMRSNIRLPRKPANASSERRRVG